MTDQRNQRLGSRDYHHLARRDEVDLDMPDRHDLSADLVRRARIAALFASGEWGGISSWLSRKPPHQK